MPWTRTPRVRRSWTAIGPPRCLDEWIDRTPRARSEQREADRLFPGGQRAETSPDESIGERALGVLRVCVESVFASAYRPKA